MAVHVPLSAEAQAEARILMLSSNNILSPGARRAAGDADPGHGARDLLPDLRRRARGAGRSSTRSCGRQGAATAPAAPRSFRTAQEAELAYENGLVKLHDHAEYRRPGHEHFLTTVGRIIFNDRVERALADALGRRVRPGEVRVRQPLAEEARRQRDRHRPGRGLRRRRDLAGARRLQGARASTSPPQAGITISKNDVVSPPNKEEILERYEKRGGRDPRPVRRGLHHAEERKERGHRPLEPGHRRGRDRRWRTTSTSSTRSS